MGKYLLLSSGAGHGLCLQAASRDLGIRGVNGPRVGPFRLSLLSLLPFVNQESSFHLLHIPGVQLRPAAIVNDRMKEAEEKEVAAKMRNCKVSCKVCVIPSSPTTPPPQDSSTQGLCSASGDSQWWFSHSGTGTPLTQSACHWNKRCRYTCGSQRPVK